MIKALLVLGCVVLALVIAVGLLACVMGFESISTGINPGSWLMSLGLLVVAPMIGLAVCLWMLIRRKGSSEEQKCVIPVMALLKIRA